MSISDLFCEPLYSLDHTIFGLCSDSEWTETVLTNCKTKELKDWNLNWLLHIYQFGSEERKKEAEKFLQIVVNRFNEE